MSGTVNISRSLWDDPTFKDAEMSQREAWIWLIAEASWKDRIKRVGTHEISLQRGQLAASSRFMAKAWGWSEPRVRRYLDMLENQRMIERATDAGISVVTIRKYDDYQNAPRVDDARPTHQPTQQRRTTDANENKGEIRDKVREEGKPSSLAHSDRFQEFWDAYPHRGGAKKGRAPAEKKYRAAIKAGVSEQAIIDGAARYRGDRGVCDGFAKDPATWLNQRGWEDEVEARASKAVPASRVPQYGEQRTTKDGRTIMWAGAIDQWVEVRQ